MQTTASLESISPVEGLLGNCSEPQRKYWVSPDVHVCNTENGIVLLDLRQNKYFALPIREARALASAVNRWPADISDDSPEISVIYEFADSLVATGLLTEAEPTGAPICSSVSIQSALLASEDEVTRIASIRLTYVPRFVFAYFSAKHALAHFSIRDIAMRLMANRQNARHSFRSVDEDYIFDLVECFALIRPFVFSARDQCLLHSVTLLFFLSRFQVFPTWVIGVRENPWGAHSWVQCGATVLDSTPEKVAEYRPILTV